MATSVSHLIEAARLIAVSLIYSVVDVGIDVAASDNEQTGLSQTIKLLDSSTA